MGVSVPGWAGLVTPPWSATVETGELAWAVAAVDTAIATGMAAASSRVLLRRAKPIPE